MSPVKEKSADHELISRFKKGSLEAMEKIVGLYEKSIFNFGLRICGHTQDAEDIMQETFLNAFRSLDRFRGETKLKNWLFTIAANACKRKRRKKKGEPERELSLEAFMPQEGTDLKYEIPDFSNDPAEDLMRTELRELIETSVRSLPQKYRLVFLLRDIEGFSSDETGRILGISSKAVKTRLHRARLYLREEISNYYREEQVHGC